MDELTKTFEKQIAWAHEEIQRRRKSLGLKAFDFSAKEVQIRTKKKKLKSWLKRRRSWFSLFQK